MQFVSACCLPPVALFVLNTVRVVVFTLLVGVRFFYRYIELASYCYTAVVRRIILFGLVGVSCPVACPVATRTCNSSTRTYDVLLFPLRT